MRLHGIFTACALGAALSFNTFAATVWTGPPTVFSKTGAETTQDVLTANVSLTRGNGSVLFNPLGGDGGPNPLTTPSDTEWAFRGLGGNPGDSTFGAGNFMALSFDTFVNALGGFGAGGGAGGGLGDNIVGRPGVLHLISDDIYLDITFSVWDTALAGAAMSYTRSTVPVPAALPLLAAALGVLGWRGRAALLGEVTS